MSNSINRAKLTATITLILLMASITLVAMPIAVKPVQAQIGAHGGTPGTSQWGPLPAGVTPDVTVITYAYLSVRPNPVGVGQSALINIWTTPSAHATVYASNYKTTITKPDGTVDTKTMNSYYADRTSWFEYVVDQVGTWKFQLDYPGDYYPAGIYTHPLTGANTTFTESRWYKPSTSPVTELVVQQDPVLSWPPAPLPTHEYWERPVQPHNREWWALLGNFPWSGDGSSWASIWPKGTNYFKGNTKYDAWVITPDSSHIVWKRQDTIAGIIGTELYTVSLIPSFSYTSTGNVPTLIYAGRCYATMTVPYNGVPTNCAVCYDLRTGEMYYTIPTAAPYNGVTPTSILMYRDTSGEAVPGTEARLEGIVELLVIGNRLLKINPWTGAVTTNVTGMPGTKIGPYVISMQTNNTAIGNRLINWSLVGSSSNFTSRIVENRSVQFSSIGSNVDWEAGVFGTLSSITPSGAPSTPTGCIITGYSLKTGQMTCNFTDDLVPYQTGCVAVDHGKIACLMQNGYAAAYDLTKGKRAWVSQQTYEVGGYPWGIWGAYLSASAYGNYILNTYAGVVAFDWETGKISWMYRDPSPPFETPYAGYYSFDSGIMCADGKVFSAEVEHSQSMPITRGWRLHCINGTTGEGIWNITGSATYMGTAIPVAYADGYLTYGSTDGYLYVIGRGKSQTTVTTPDTAVPLGTAVVIKGTVTDLSPAQPGTPCVSKGTMTLQMEYLHMQMPIGGIWGNETIIGVPVTLTAIGSEGTVYDLGTVTTNGYYGTFGYTWKPPKEDTYTIMASFAGDDSYGSSSAGAILSVGPAPASPTPTPTEQPQAQPDNTPLIYATAAIIAAIVIVGLLIILSLRKRQ
jgi:hypothetical protein